MLQSSTAPQGYRTTFVTCSLQMAGASCQAFSSLACRSPTRFLVLFVVDWNRRHPRERREEIHVRADEVIGVEKLRKPKPQLRRVPGGFNWRTLGTGWGQLSCLKDEGGRTKEDENPALDQALELKTIGSLDVLVVHWADGALYQLYKYKRNMW